MLTRLLDNGYGIEVDQVTEADWYSYLHHFDDASLYQTWSYGTVRWGEEHLSHLILRRGQDVIALAQLSIMRMPITGGGIAYLPWGPVWRVKDRSKDFEGLHRMLRALREEYVVRRGLLLRVIPNETDIEDGKIRATFENEGLRRTQDSYRTILLDLSGSMEELRRNLSSNWRRNLSKAEKNGLRLTEGTKDVLYETLLVLYKEMVSRKRFVPGIDINEFRTIQKRLPASFKMRIMVCEFNGRPVSAIVVSAMGEMGKYLIGATGDEGLNLRGSFLLHWRMVEWLKECGCRYYDLGGIDRERNPGGYWFKAGLEGKEVSYVGQFDACENRMSSTLVTWGDKLRRGQGKYSLGSCMRSLARLSNLKRGRRDEGTFRRPEKPI